MIKQIVNNADELLYVTLTDVHGGQEMRMVLTHEAHEMITWLRAHKAQLSQEAELRAKNPELQHLYDQYQTYLKLVSEPK